MISIPFEVRFRLNSNQKSMNKMMMMMMMIKKKKKCSSYQQWSQSSWLMLFSFCLILVIFSFNFNFVNCSTNTEVFSEVFPYPPSSTQVPIIPISIPFGLPSSVSSPSPSPEIINCTIWNPFNLWTKNGNRKHKRSLIFKRKRLKERRKIKKNNGNKKWPMFYNNDTSLLASGNYNYQLDHGHGHDGHPQATYNKDNDFINGQHQLQQQQQQSIFPQIPPPSSTSYYYYYNNNNPHPHHQDDHHHNQNQGLIIHPSALAATATMDASALPFQQPNPQQLPQHQHQFLLPLTQHAASSQGAIEFPQEDPAFFPTGTGTMAHLFPSRYPYHSHHHQTHAHLTNPSILYPTIYDFEDYHQYRHQDDHQHDRHHHHKDHLPLDYDPMILDGTNESEEQLDQHKGEYRKRNPNVNHYGHHHQAHDHRQRHHHHRHHGGHHGHGYHRRPVAKDLLSDKHNNYYEPFPVDPIRGYYLGGSLSSSTSNYEDEDEEEDNTGDHGYENNHGKDDHGGYHAKDHGHDYKHINNNNNNNNNHKKCYRRKQWNQNDLDWALKHAHGKMKWYSKTIQKNALDTRRRTPYIPNGVLDAKIFEYATYYLKQRLCLTKMDVVKMLPKIDSKKIIENQYEMYACRQEYHIICEPKARYRSIDGACNNLKKKTWSKSFTCHRRLLPPDYADGVAKPRQSYYGVGKLPNAREISSFLLPDIDVLDPKLTSMAMAFGQFIIHDIARTLPTANDIRCCPVNKAVHPECFAIEIKRSDDVLRKYFNQTCINFLRSVVCNPCGLGPREQQNQATHTFDMSQMYGLRLNDSLPLRTFRGGKLRSSFTSSVPKEELPPKMVHEDPGCNIRPKPPRFKCFETADGLRASQHPALQSMHTVFHRRHNQHTDGLAKINPHWNDEKLYQEARHITIAEVSNIIYGQYLSSVFGEKLMKHFRLNLRKQGYTRYNPKLNPSTLQEFITAAGRFGHSQINQRFRVVFSDPKLSYSYRLRDNFFETTIVSLGHSGGVLKGLSLDSTQASDPYFVDDVKNSLYHLRKERLGRDLPAFNIQRGREHGIPGYVYYLDFCFGFKVYNWNDLATFIPAKHLKKIRLFYRHWNDIDLFVGGVFERLMDGAAFGPTFGCINGIQFYNLKYGDRFYFEHGYQSGSFNLEQLDNIRKVSTLSSIICKTHPEMDQMPSNVFIKTSPMDNPLVPCFKFPELDYNLWLDTRHKYKKKPKPDEDYPKSKGKIYSQPSNAISEHNGGDDDDEYYGAGGPTTSSPYMDHKYGYSKKYHYHYRNHDDDDGYADDDEDDVYDHTYPDPYNQTTPPSKKQQEEDNYWDFGNQKADTL